MANLMQRLMNSFSSSRDMGKVKRHLPMLNEVRKFSSSFLYAQGQVQKKKALMRLCKNNPELLGFLNKVVFDATSSYHFEPVNHSLSGRNKLQAANKFAMQVKLDSVMESQFFDMLGTGEGFGWIGKLTKSQINKALDGVLERHGYVETKVVDDLRAEFKLEEGISSVAGISEEVLTPRKYRYIPSTTVEIIHDDHDILFYNHGVDTNEPVQFTTDEMIHFTLMDRDGKVNGFSPVESLLVQLELLRQMWQNMLSIHVNGGSPDRLFILENTRVNTPEYERIEEQLQKYKLVENKHGNMLFTGGVKVEQLNALEDMQFKDSGLYVTGLIAMQWGIPKSSIPFILGDTNTDDKGGNSERGYWRVIEKFQKRFAMDMNTQLWIPYFGVKIVFDNPFAQFDVQKQTALQVKLGNIQVLDSILAVDNKMLSEEKRLELLNLSPDDITEKPMELDPMTGNTMNQRLPESQVQGSEEQQQRSQAKRSEQQTSIQSRGMKPTGMGKESFQFKDIEFKEWSPGVEQELRKLIGTVVQKVDINTFVKLYMEDRSYHPGKPPRIFVRMNDTTTTFIFRSIDFVYKSKINNSELDPNQMQVLMMNIGDQLYRL